MANLSNRTEAGKFFKCLPNFGHNYNWFYAHAFCRIIIGFLIPLLIVSCSNTSIVIYLFQTMKVRKIFSQKFYYMKFIFHSFERACREGHKNQRPQNWLTYGPPRKKNLQVDHVILFLSTPGDLSDHDGFEKFTSRTPFSCIIYQSNEKFEI